MNAMPQWHLVMQSPTKIKKAMYCFGHRQTLDFKSSTSPLTLCSEEDKVALGYRIFGSNFLVKGLAS